MSTSQREYNKGPSLCYIIDIGYYTDASSLEKIEPFEQMEEFIKSLQCLGYTVYQPTQPSRSFNWEQLSEFTERLSLARFPPELGSIMIVFQCHGVARGIYSSDGKLLPYELFEHIFGTNRSLVNKPKVIIYNCCAGPHAPIYPDVFI